jgi:hypothetical protein
LGPWAKSWHGCPRATLSRLERIVAASRQPWSVPGVPQRGAHGSRQGKTWVPNDALGSNSTESAKSGIAPTISCHAVTLIRSTLSQVRRPIDDLERRGIEFGIRPGAFEPLAGLVGAFHVEPSTPYATSFLELFLVRLPPCEAAPPPPGRQSASNRRMPRMPRLPKFRARGRPKRETSGFPSGSSSIRRYKWSTT